MVDVLTFGAFHTQKTSLKIQCRVKVLVKAVMHLGLFLQTIHTGV